MFFYNMLLKDYIIIALLLFPCLLYVLVYFIVFVSWFINEYPLHRYAYR